MLDSTTRRRRPQPIYEFYLKTDEICGELVADIQEGEAPGLPLVLYLVSEQHQRST